MRYIRQSRSSTTHRTWLRPDAPIFSIFHSSVTARNIEPEKSQGGPGKDPAAVNSIAAHQIYTATSLAAIPFRRVTLDALTRAGCASPAMKAMSSHRSYEQTNSDGTLLPEISTFFFPFLSAAISFRRAWW